MIRTRTTWAGKALMMGVIAVASVLAAVAPTPAQATNPTPPFIPADASWLTTVNYYRAMAGLGPVAENTMWSAGAENHACYMLHNGISHDEIPGRTGYTASGDAAGNASNVAVSSGTGVPAREFIELWMTGPFHAIGVLRPGLQSVGYGQCEDPNAPEWSSGAALDVIRGLVPTPRPAAPILFPGQGTTTNLAQFRAETPNPLTFCGYSGPAGFPVIAMMPEQTTAATATMTGPAGPVEVCALTSGNTTGSAAAILGGDNAVVVVPRNPLTAGVHQVTVTTSVRTVTWSFRVDPQAAIGMPALPQVTPTGAAARLTTMTPFRFADSRLASRITPLFAGVPKRIRIAGIAGIPTGTTSVSANFTVTRPAGASYLTIYNCAATAPTVSTLNFSQGETVANGGLFPLSTQGDICVLSPTATHLIIDINGYTIPSGALGYTPASNRTVLNTEVAAGETFTTQINEPSPAGTAAAVTVTTSETVNQGFITLYDCETTRPTVSSVNQSPDAVKQNFAIVPVPATGRICGYSSSATKVRIDVAGMFNSAGATFNAAAPTRMVDTRDLYRPSVNLGTGGTRLVANEVTEVPIAGQGGIPTEASAVSMNVTVASPLSTGSLTVWDCNSDRGAAIVSFSAGKAVANGALVDLSPGGEICVSTTTATHVIFDITGWWS